MADLSPHSMADAAYNAAVAKREWQGETTTTTTKRHKVYALNEPDDAGSHEISGGLNPCPAKIFKISDDGEAGAFENRPKDFDRESAAAGVKIEKIWKSGGDVEDKFEETLRIVIQELDDLMQYGLSAFHELDATSRKLAQSKEVAEAKAREVQRLHSIDEESRSSLSNLLRAVEASKADARDSSRAAQTEARLRAEVNSLRDQRDKAVNEITEYRRKVSLHEEELRLTKSKLSRAMQEKMCMERDSRQAISLARSLDTSNSSDMNYYKRKVTELSDKLQMAQDSIANQKKQIAELAGQGGGSFSQRY